MVLLPDRKEIIRYLGYRGVAPDVSILKEIELGVAQLQEAVTPRFVYEQFPIRRSRGQNSEEQLCFAGMTIVSRDLSRNLRDCHAVYLMAATLGPGPDTLIRRASIGKVSHAVILQAAAAAMTETWCDQVNDRIRRETEKDGLFIRPRYSPGYGDLSLTVQTDISRILNMPKEIGVSLTDTLLMTPSKSVTALIGVAKTPADCHKSGCAACSAASTCPYRA